MCSNKRGSDSFFKDDFFQDGKDSLNDAKQLFAQGEKMFKNGQFQKGQQLFQQAEQQLRQAKTQTPMQPFKSSSMDFKVPKIEFGDTAPSWKTSTLALFGVGAVATLVAGRLSIPAPSVNCFFDWKALAFMEALAFFAAFLNYEHGMQVLSLQPS